MAPLPPLNKDKKARYVSRHPFSHPNCSRYCFCYWVSLLGPWNEKGRGQFSFRKFRGSRCPTKDLDLEGQVTNLIFVQRIRVLFVPKLADRNISQHHLCDLKGFKEQVRSYIGIETKRDQTIHVKAGLPHSSRPLGFHPSCSLKSTLCQAFGDAKDTAHHRAHPKARVRAQL